MKLLFTILTLFLAGAQYGQAIIDNIELTIREDLNPPGAGGTITGFGYTAYSVYARPIQSYSNSYNLGNTQISVVLPTNLTYWTSTFSAGSTGSFWVDSDQGGNWSNVDFKENVAPFNMDYHAVFSSGREMNGGNPLVAGTEYRMYTIYVQGDCNNGIRLFINGQDPDSQSMPDGGDFENNFIHQVAGGNFPDEYSNNYSSGTPICLPVLPVELVGFDVEKRGSEAILTWVTATEINNDYFEVQRSVDGKVWETIGMVNGAGTTTVTQQYEYVDGKPYLGVNYYRLEQFDLDGGSEYSDVRKVAFEDGQDVLSVVMFPNPTAGQLRITANQLLDNHTMLISDITGKVLMNNDFVNGSEINLQNFKPGLFLVRIINQRGEVITTKRIIKTAN